MNLFFLQKKTTKVRAFTLLEVLASLSIVTMIILGPLTFSINSSSVARQTKDIMISMYLSQEAFELLHFQYDSLYIACIHDQNPCSSNPTSPGELPGEKAWRLFKERLNYDVSCFDSDGCSYDFLDMLNPESSDSFARYSPTSNSCSNISTVYSKKNILDTKIRNYYVCSGIDKNSPRLVHDSIQDVKKTNYTRKIFVVSTPTIDEGTPPIAPTNLELSQDDLEFTVTVSFKRSNGVIRTMKYIDVLHSRT